MNLPTALCEPLGHAGHDAEHWSRLGDPRATDATIMEWAANNDAVVVTHDLDFSAILASTRGTSPSVV